MNESCKSIAEKAVKALLYEVSVTPKPGLVDCSNSGAHRDMNFYTFLNSASVLQFYFYESALISFLYKKNDLSGLLSLLRNKGIKAEEKMFTATSGVNTHKGAIFSLGLIAASAGYLSGKNEVLTASKICETAALIAAGITNELNCEKNENLTAGEQIFRKYGIRGIREEAENGYPTVINYGIPVLKNLSGDSKNNLNEKLIKVFLNLLIQTTDTNILNRHDRNTLSYAQMYAANIVSKDLSGEELIQKTEKMDKDFITKNISPGGTADLLAVTIYLGLLEGIDF